MKLVYILFLFFWYASTCFSQALQWEARYNGNANLADEANDMTVDSRGNVYVTGESYRAEKVSDYVTMKYSFSGIPLWVSTFNRTGGSLDRGIAIAVDDAGNVYVTGSSGKENESDIVTVKYDSSGVEQWQQQFSGSGGSTDIPTGIALDASGDVYVLGQTFGGGTLLDYLLIKYTSSGTQQWARTYNGAASSNDSAWAMKIDGSSALYVTGSSIESDDLQNITTIKYDLNGAQLWVANYDSIAGSGKGKGIAVDGAGNVYVAGSGLDTLSFYNFITLKYDASGNYQWAAQYDGPVHKDDLATAIEVDSIGNAYVTGKSTGRNTKYDFATIRYNPDGTQQWVQRYDNRKRNDDIPGGMALDIEGGVYVTGSSIGSSGKTPDIVTVKYDSAGVMQWNARNKGFVNGANNAVAIAIDSGFGVIVSGHSDGGASDNDYLTLKYAQYGNTVWEFQDVGTSKALFAVEAADEDNVWAAGAGGTIFHSSDHGFAWIQQNTPPLMPDLLAMSFPTTTTGYAVGKKGYILKTTDAGDTWIWLNNAGKNWSKTDLNRVYFINPDTGYATGKNGNLIRTTDGGSIWTTETFPAVKFMKDVFFLNDSIAWAAGQRGALRSSSDSGATWDTLKDGGVNWTKLDLTKICFIDSLNGWTSGVKGALLNTTDGGVTWTDFTPYNLKGKPIAPIQYSQMRMLNSSVAGLAATKGAVAFASNVNGQSVTISHTGEKGDMYDVTFSGNAMWTVGKFGVLLRSSTVTAPYTEWKKAGKFETAIPYRATLQQNYPNPFNPGTVIRYSLPVKSIVTLKIYDMLGREVAVLLHDAEMTEGDHSVEFNATTLASGVYFYRVQVRGESGSLLFTDVKRMLLLK